MGLLERLFGTGSAKVSPVRSPAPPKPASRPEPAAKETAAEPVAEPEAPRAVEEPAPKAVESANTPAPDTVKSTDTSAPVPGEVETVVEVAEEAALAADAPGVAEPLERDPADGGQSGIDEHLQKRLDTYFARLRRDFPDGRIVRLNTGHKKLAERGAQLRRLIGYEGRLDEFFALGGFTYERSTGGRPPLPAEQTASVEERLRARFPDDVPTALAVQQADHRLYLDLRAAARREGCTVGDYLNQFRDD